MLPSSCQISSTFTTYRMSRSRGNNLLMFLIHSCSPLKSIHTRESVNTKKLHKLKTLWLWPLFYLLSKTEAQFDVISYLYSRSLSASVYLFFYSSFVFSGIFMDFEYTIDLKFFYRDKIQNVILKERSDQKKWSALSDLFFWTLIVQEFINAASIIYRSAIFLRNAILL